MMKRMALLTSGGDAPGMNAALRAATLLARARGVEVLGVQYGYEGLLQNRMVSMDSALVSNLIREGGTYLGSTRCPEFTTIEGRRRAREVLYSRGIDSLVVIGGNGSLTGMHRLLDSEESKAAPEGYRLRAVGIPASIDNDVGLTRLSIGVDTAVNTIVDACDRISDTASAHDRTFIVEVMGRDSGYWR